MAQEDTTSLSHWQRLTVNDKPDDRFNCFITTAVGLLELESIEDLKNKFKHSQEVQDAIWAHENFKTDGKRGAYLDEIKEFYKNLGLQYVGVYVSDYQLMDHFNTEVKVGENRKFALAYDNGGEPEVVANRAVSNADQMISANGHMVSVRAKKTAERVSYIVTDHQISRCRDGSHEWYECYLHHRRSKFIQLHYDKPKYAFFRYATPPFYLFEKIVS